MGKNQVDDPIDFGLRGLDRLRAGLDRRRAIRTNRANRANRAIRGIRMSLFALGKV